MRWCLACLVVAGACSSNDDRAQPKPQATLTGTKPLQMRNCPSAVPTAITTTTPTADGIEVNVTSVDPVARLEIVARADRQIHQGDPIRFLPPHTGMHGGPGTMGYCPIIHASTSVSYVVTRDGVRFHVTAHDSADVAALQRATEARARTFAIPSS